MSVSGTLGSLHSKSVPQVKFSGNGNGASTDLAQLFQGTGIRNCLAQPDDLSDITFLVEEKKIHFNKTILSAISPVFNRMFNSDFVEKNLSEIPLPGKSYRDIVVLFNHVHPSYTHFIGVQGWSD